MEHGLSVRAAMREATGAVSGNLAAFSLPLVVYVGSFRVAAIFTAHHTQSRGVVLAFIGLLALCMVCGVVLQAGVSDLYLRWKLSGERPDFANTLQPTHYSGFFSVVRQLFVRYIGWLVPGILAGMLLYALITLGHHGPPKSPNYLRTLIGIATYDAIASQYGFVIPTLVFGRAGSKQRFVESVRLARRFWVTLALAAVVETVVVLGPNDLIRDLLTRHAASRVVDVSWQCVNVLFTAIFAAWYGIFRTALMMQARTMEGSPEV